MKNPTHYSVFVHTVPGTLDSELHVHAVDYEEEVRHEANGALVVHTCHGETHHYAPGVWTTVKVRAEGGESDD